ncbi:MAG: TonB-dependent receptor, partial [Thalassolituus sp.]
MEFFYSLNAPTWGGIPGWYSDGTRTDYSRSKTTAADWAYWNSTHKNIFAEIKQAINEDWTVNAHVTRGTTESESRLLYVYGNPDRDTGEGIFPWTGGKFSSDTSYTMADIYVSGRFDLLGYEQQASFGISRSERDFKALSANATYAAPIGDFNEWDGKNYPEHIWDETFLYEEYTDTQTAVYGSTRIQLTDKLSTVLGARITNQEIDRKAAAYNEADVYEYDSIFTPYAGLLYDFNETYTGYISYTEIFSPQELRDKNADLLEPIFGKSVEAGVKAGFANDALIATAAVFQTQQDNLGVVDEGNSVAGTADQAYKESEGATSEGYELEVTGAVTENWEVQLGWTSYEVKDADGEKINTEQPRKIFKSYTRYQLPGDFNKITLGGGINWEGDSYATATNPVSGNP